MTERTPDRPTEEPTSDRQEWRTPILTALGDARELTEAAGITAPDGGATSS
jgi:hypothetical protein